jgi:hypothetical protein
MSDIPVNDLDRAILKLGKSKSALPEFMRQLGTGELWALVPWHPEVEGECIELKNGAPFPFSMLEDKEGTIVPIFSSRERLRECVKKLRVPARTYSYGSLEARVMLQVLGGSGLRAVVNRMCKTGEVTIEADMMRDVADGSAFATTEPEPTTSIKMQILDAADYPTNLIQPLYELFRQHACIRAAWIFGRQVSESEPPGGRGYKLLVLAEPRDAAVLHDANIVAQNSKGEMNEVFMGTVPDNDGTYTAQLFSSAEPFYVAADYERPPAVKL